MVSEQEAIDSETGESLNGSNGKRSLGFKEMEVIEVNRDNFNKIWPYMLICVKSADFIGLDLELSGLGGKGLRSKDIEERYRSIRDAAMTRSVLSLGISTMKLIKKNEKKIKYQAQIFNILTLSENPFTVEPNALKFLAKHSFDFNRLINCGVQFQGKDCHLRTLFHELLGTSSHLCLHNGLIDLAFIYQHFYGVTLPPTLDEFCNNLSELFPLDFLPVVDSKYLAEYQTRFSSSFLEYVFRRSQGDNEIERQNKRIYVQVEFPDSNGMMSAVKDAIEKVNCSLPEEFPDHPIPFNLHNYVCMTFLNHGFCYLNNQGKCSKLHDVDSAIDIQRCKERKKSFKRKRRYNGVIAESVAEKNEATEENWKNNKFDDSLKVSDIKEKLFNRRAVAGIHRAGVDAFMTVFSVVYQQRIDLLKNDSVNSEFANKLPLSGKEQPVTISARNILKKNEKEEDEHRVAIETINKNRERNRELLKKVVN